MAKRGPKTHAAKRTPKQAPIGGLWEGFAPPADLAPAALAEFHRLTSNLRRVGTLHATDPRLVLQAARLQALLDEAHATIASEGLRATGGHGSPIPHPLLSTVNSLTIRLRGLWYDMGLTAPSSKHGDPAKAENPSDDGWGDLLSVTG